MPFSYFCTHFSLYHQDEVWVIEFPNMYLKEAVFVVSSYKLSLEVSSPMMLWQLQNPLRARLFELIALPFSTNGFQLMAQNGCLSSSHSDQREEGKGEERHTPSSLEGYFLISLEGY